MKVINFAEHNTVINNYIAELRDVDIQKNRAWFRQNLRRIGHAMAYEVSKTLTYSEKTVETPLAPARVNTTDDRIVIGTVLRAGLALHEGFLDVFSGADSAFVSAYRKEGRKDDIEICVEYIASPDLNGCTFMLVDPMLATGGSFNLAYQAYLTKGKPAHLHICAVIGCEEGVKRLGELFPSDDVTLWIAAIDPVLNEKAYIVPGLGDAGDLCYGDKLSD